MINVILWHKNLEKKIFKRRRIILRKKKKVYSSNKFSGVGINRKFFSCELNILNKAEFIQNNLVNKVIYSPKNFLLKENFDECILFFKNIISSYILGNGNIVISFEKCSISSIASFSLLEILIKELQNFKYKYNINKFKVCEKEIYFKHSIVDIKTNKYLHSFFGLQLPDNQNDGSRYLKLKMLTGKKRVYYENSKTIACSKITEFVNNSAQEVGAELNEDGKHALDGLLGEVLGNAEDHCANCSHWFVDGISFSEKQHEIDVVDLNLSIINFGLSMFEGFENTKLDNAQNYAKCQNKYEKHKSLFTMHSKFDKEALFTLYMLNDGISRLKYKDESRGNGMMKFLKSFISLGSFGEQDARFKCQLNVVSGHTILTCDNDMKYYKKGTFNVLSLNKENDMDKLPDKNYLKSNSMYFPGTILECHIYLNKTYFYKELNGNN